MNPDAFANPGGFSPSFDIPCERRWGGQHDRRFEQARPCTTPIGDPSVSTSRFDHTGEQWTSGDTEEAGSGAETGARRGNDSSDFQRLRKTCRSRGDTGSPRVPDESSPRARSRTSRGPQRRVPCAGCPSASRTGRHCAWMPATPETKHAASASSRRACSVLMRFRDRGVASRKTPPRSPGVLNRKLSISDAVYSR